MAKIEVRPLETKRWHNKVGKEDFARPKKIQALVDAVNGVYCTGLSKEEEEKYSKLLKKDLSSHFSPDEPHPFWDTKQAEVKLENHTMFFDEDIPLEFIKIKIMKASKYVANSMKDYNEGKYPFATHVIFNELEEVEVKASKIELRNKAIAEAAKLTNDRKAQIILIASGTNYRGMSEDAMIVALDEAINKNPEDIYRLIKQNKEDTYLHAVVLEAMQKSIIVKRGHQLKHFEVSLGVDVYEAIDTLKKPEFDEVKLRIVAALNQ